MEVADGLRPKVEGNCRIDTVLKRALNGVIVLLKGMDGVSIVRVQSRNPGLEDGWRCSTSETGNTKMKLDLQFANPDILRNDLCDVSFLSTLSLCAFWFNTFGCC